MSLTSTRSSSAGRHTLDGTLRVFDVRDPRKPKQILEKKIGNQVNMVSQSWDGERVYFFYGTSDLIAFDFAGKQLWHRNIQEDYGSFAFLWT